MSYITVPQAINRSRAQWASSRIAETEIRKSAGSSYDSVFDVFLSHSYENADVVAGVKGYIEDQGLSVYVDWIEDPDADRSRVTADTAEMLRQRMNHSRFLLYASSDAARDSRWMPWELGYFDGRRPGHVGIAPIVQSGGDKFRGQEYLWLYPHFELINIREIGVCLAHDIDERSAQLLKQAVRAA
jgi:TIR domain